MPVKNSKMSQKLTPEALILKSLKYFIEGIILIMIVIEDYIPIGNKNCYGQTEIININEM